MNLLYRIGDFLDHLGRFMLLVLLVVFLAVLVCLFIAAVFA